MTKWFFFADFVAKASTNIPKIKKALENLVADDVLAVRILRAEDGRVLKFYEHISAFRIRNDQLEQEIQDYVFEKTRASHSRGTYDYMIFDKFGNANKNKISKRLVKYEELGYLKTTQLELKLPNNIPAWQRAYAPTCKFCARA